MASKVRIGRSLFECLTPCTKSRGRPTRRAMRECDGLGMAGRSARERVLVQIVDADRDVDGGNVSAVSGTVLGWTPRVSLPPPHLHQLLSLRDEDVFAEAVEP